MSKRNPGIHQWNAKFLGPQVIIHVLPVHNHRLIERPDFLPRIPANQKGREIWTLLRRRPCRRMILPVIHAHPGHEGKIESKQGREKPRRDDGVVIEDEDVIGSSIRKQVGESP